MRRASPHSSGWSDSKRWSWSFQRGAEKRTAAEKRAHLRGHRPARISVAQGCRLMGLARSTNYVTPTRVVDDTALVDAIFRIADEFEAYGYRRLGAARRQQGLVVNHKKLRRLMRADDLQPKRRPRYVATTDSAHEGPIFPNVAKDLVVTGPNQLSVSDITYVALPSRFVYVGIILPQPPSCPPAGRTPRICQNSPGVDTR